MKPGKDRVTQFIEVKVSDVWQLIPCDNYPITSSLLEAWGETMTTGIVYHGWFYA